MNLSFDEGSHRRGLNPFNLAGVLWCAALIGYALYAQHVLGQEPCPLCILQRIAVIAVGIVFLAALLHRPGRLGARIYAALLAVAALSGIGVAARQLWIMSQPAGAVAECGASLDYMMDVLPLHEVLAKVLTGSGECAKDTWQFLGLSMPSWVILNLAGLLLLGLYANLSRK